MTQLDDMMKRALALREKKIEEIFDAVLEDMRPREGKLPDIIVLGVYIEAMSAVTGMLLAQVEGILGKEKRLEMEQAFSKQLSESRDWADEMVGKILRS